jgi:2'-5' RNA ligase
MLYFIALIPPKPLQQEITAIKQDFADRFESRKALRTMPHITLKAPFKIPESERATFEKWFADLRFDAIDFRIKLDGFGAFEQDHPVVFIKPEMNGEMAALQRETVEKIAAKVPASISHTDRDFHPHITIGYRDLTPENFEKAWNVYKTHAFEAEFRADAIHLLRHDGTQWVVVSSVKLTH